MGGIDHEFLSEELRALVTRGSYTGSWDVAEHVQANLQMLELDAKILASDFSDTVICSVGDGPGIVLAAHLDTVAPKKGQESLELRKDGDKLFGLGTSDDKSGVAALLTIAKALDISKLRNRITFILAGKEENVSRGENPLWQMTPVDAEYGLYLEPTLAGSETAYVGMGCMGLLRLQVSFFGESMASWHSNGNRNPICMATDFARQFADWAEAEESAHEEIDLLGAKQRLHTNLNITEFIAQEGGGVIPHRATLTIDCRIVPSSISSSRKHITRNEIYSQIERFRFSSQIGKYEEKPIRIISDYDGYLLEDPHLYQVCSEHLTKAGFTPEPWFAPWRTDSAALISRHGIPSVVVGPGQYDQCHKPGEHILVDAFHRCSDAIAGIVFSLVY